MAGVHGLQEVEGLRAAHLADDDALRTHTQAVLDEVAHRDLALAFDVRRARLEAHDVRLLELQLGGVLAGDHAFVGVDVARQAVEQRRLAGTGAAGDKHVAANAPDNLQDGRALRRNRAEAYKLVKRQLVLLELADGECRSIDGKRRRDHVDPRAVGQTGVAYRAGLVDAAADLADDALADVEELRV